MSVAVLPSDARLGWSSVVHAALLNSTTARFDRDYGAAYLERRWFGPAVGQTGGLRVRWRTTAPAVTAHVHYRMVCDVHCAVDACDRCSVDTGSCYAARAGCGSSCAMTLLLDGAVVAGAADGSARAAGRYDGPVDLTFPPAPPGAHDFALVWPWGASIDFRGLTLSGGGPGGAGLEAVGALSTTDAAAAGTTEPPWRGLRYVAYGDSITHGFCGLSDAYPEQLGRLNGFETFNLGGEAIACNHHVLYPRPCVTTITASRAPHTCVVPHARSEGPAVPAPRALGSASHARRLRRGHRAPRPRDRRAGARSRHARDRHQRRQRCARRHRCRHDSRRDPRGEARGAPSHSAVLRPERSCSFPHFGRLPTPP